MSNADFAPESRQMMFRGKPVWEVDCRRKAWTPILQRIGAPERAKFNTKSEAQAYCRRLVVAEARGEPLVPVTLPVRSYFARYMIWIEKSKPHNTQKNYRGNLRKFRRYLDSQELYDVSDVSSAVVQQFIEHKTGQLAPVSIQTCVAIVSGAFAWGVKCGLISSNPCYRMIPRAPRPNKRALTGAERQTIMRDDGPRGDYWRFLLLTGLRRAELASLLSEDIDLDAGVVHVIGAKGGKNRDIPLVAQARTVARKLVLAAPEGHIVPYTANHLGRLWTQDRERLGIAEDVTPHTFRHDFISSLANDPKVALPAVQQVVGHERLETTAVYIHKDPEAMRAVMLRRAESVS